MIAALPLVTSALSMAMPSITSQATSTAASAASTGGDFGQMMAQMAGDTVKTLKTAESMSIDGLQGNANVQAVVSAVMAAQESLQTTVAIRDKAVAAFQEVTRMPI